MMRGKNSWFLICVPIAVICLVMTVVMWFRLESYIEKDKEKAEINQTLVLEKINTVSELCVTELSFREVMKFEKGSIPIINQNKFTMVYSAKAKLGFDLSETEVNVEDKKITKQKAMYPKRLFRNRILTEQLKMHRKLFIKCLSLLIIRKAIR
jgi:hypothetical protein